MNLSALTDMLEQSPGLLQQIAASAGGGASSGGEAAPEGGDGGGGGGGGGGPAGGQTPSAPPLPPRRPVEFATPVTATPVSTSPLAIDPANPGRVLEAPPEAQQGTVLARLRGGQQPQQASGMNAGQGAANGLSRFGGALGNGMSAIKNTPSKWLAFAQGFGGALKGWGEENDKRAAAERQARKDRLDEEQKDWQRKRTEKQDEESSTDRRERREDMRRRTDIYEKTAGGKTAAYKWGDRNRALGEVAKQMKIWSDERREKLGLTADDNQNIPSRKLSPEERKRRESEYEEAKKAKEADLLRDVPPLPGDQSGTGSAPRIITDERTGKKFTYTEKEGVKPYTPDAAPAAPASPAPAAPDQRQTVPPSAGGGGAPAPTWRRMTNPQTGDRIEFNPATGETRPIPNEQAAPAGGNPSPASAPAPAAPPAPLIPPSEMTPGDNTLQYREDIDE